VKGNVSNVKKAALEWEDCREGTGQEKGVEVEDTL